MPYILFFISIHIYRQFFDMLNRITNLNKFTKIKHFSKLIMASSSNLCKSSQNEVIVIHDQNNDYIRITFKYTNALFNTSKTFNFNRQANEEYRLLLKRISENISKFMVKKNKVKKKKNKSDFNDTVNKDEITNIKVDLECNGKEVPINASCYDIFVKKSDDYYIKIEDQLYFLNVNPPILTTLELPKRNIMAGYLLYPSKLDGLNYDIAQSNFTWFRSNKLYENIKQANSEINNWEKVNDGFFTKISDNDIGRLFKVICTPYKDNKKGIESESISKVLVSAGPEKCPFQERQKKFTSQILGYDSLRVVSYNILADLYADSDFSRNTLFSTCPPYALDIEYRKQLLVKEIIGYNADLICLQEVDAKIFQRDLNPILNLHGLGGILKTKGGQVSEGSAIFYRKDKLRLEEESSFLLKDELQQNVLFLDILEKIKCNEKAFETIESRSNILQVTNQPSQMIVAASTHLYFKPDSDHIRLIQSWICLSLLLQYIELKKIQYSGKKFSLIFCGDFNSSPQNAVYRLMTTQYVGEDDADWSSNPEEEIKGIQLSHNLEIESACGTPPYTNYTKDFNDCLDYIFYQTDFLQVEQVVPLPSHEEVTAHEALPSVVFPSDHLALVVDLKWKI